MKLPSGNKKIGSDYLTVKITDGACNATSLGVFVTVNTLPGNFTGKVYYVNSTYDAAKDVYCTAVGNDANNGTSPSTPKKTLLRSVCRSNMNLALR